MEGGNKKLGRVCVTGGTGFVASWLVMRLLQHGYSVNTTVRRPIIAQGVEKDISHLTNLPCAAERLHIFTANLDQPDSFGAAFEGCVGVFHVAHPMDLVNKYNEEVITNKSINGILGILQACLDSKTVKRVVYTSSASAVICDTRGLEVLDEDSWSDVDYVRSSNFFGASYCISKTLTERAALEFAEKHSIDFVSVIPTWIHGPFICPRVPGSVISSLAFFIGNENQYKYAETTPFVHTDDVASAHIFLFEHPEAKGRYICSAVEIATDELSEFLSKRYPQYQMLNSDSVSDKSVKFGRISSKKLLDTGFRYKHGLEEMFDSAIECCKQQAGLF